MPQVEGYFRTALGTNSYWLGIRNTANYRPSLVNRTGSWEGNRLPVPDRVPAALAELQVQAAHGLIADAFLHAVVAACYLFLTACCCLLLPATAHYTSTGIGNGTAGPVQQQAG